MNDTPAVKSATRVLDLLEMLSVAAGSVGVSEIARRLGIPKSSTHMLMSTLEGRGYVVGDDGRRFRLNPIFQGEAGSWVGGSLAPLLRLGRGAVQRLCEATGETSLLGIQADDASIEYVTKAVSRHDLRVDGELGVRRALHATSVGLAILAFQSEEIAERALKRRLPALTRHTICDPVRLRKELEAVRRRGYALVRETNSMGASGIAAPVFVGGAVAGALSLASPAERFEALLKKGPQDLLRESQNMSRELSGQPSREGVPRVGR